MLGYRVVFGYIDGTLSDLDVRKRRELDTTHRREVGSMLGGSDFAIDTFNRKRGVGSVDWNANFAMSGNESGGFITGFMTADLAQG